MKNYPVSQTGFVMKNFKDKQKLFQRARKENWAIGQFNISNLEAMRAVFVAAQKLRSPIIIGTSEGESRFIGLDQAAALVRSFEKETGVPAILNLDHASNLDYITRAIAAGYDAIHFDGSKLDLAKNIEITGKIVSLCHKKAVLTEGEIDLMSGISKILEQAPEKIILTDPATAEKFVKATKVDSLAINVGTFHGVDASGKDAPIDFSRLAEIKKIINDKAFLVLHGGSGVAENDIQNAIKSGIVKININTDLRIAFTRALKVALESSPNEITPYKYLPQTITAVQKIVEQKISAFGSLNRF